LSDDELANLVLQRNAMRKARAAREAAKASATAAATEQRPEPVTATPQTAKPPVSIGKPVRFQCPYCSRLSPISEVQACIIECLMGQMAEDPVTVSAALIQTGPVDNATKELCITTLKKYAANVAKGEKFHRIRIGNAAFQSRVAVVLGAVPFLNSIGFIPSTEDGEEYLRLHAEDVEGFAARSEAAFATLASTSKVRGKLDRDLTIIVAVPGQQSLSSFDLPADFYELSQEDIRAQMQARKDEAALALTLQTQAMRASEKGSAKKYKFTMLRLRLPDGSALQGIFFPHETIGTVAEFLCSALANPAAGFSMSGPGRQHLQDYSQKLSAAGLVPSALLNVSFGDEPGCGLRPTLLAEFGLGADLKPLLSP
jgi:hypothetical protein